jgi:hypothetical protein
MHEPSFGGTDGELSQSSPGGATPRTPRCPCGAGLIAKTAIVSGLPRMDEQLRGDSVTLLFPSGGAAPRTPRCPCGAGLIAKTAIVSGLPRMDEQLRGDSVTLLFPSGGATPRTPGPELPGVSVSWIFSSGELVGTEAAR